MKYQPRVMDVPIQDDAFQENVDICKGLSIDALIEDIILLVHDSHSSEVNYKMMKLKSNWIPMKIPRIAPPTPANTVGPLPPPSTCQPTPLPTPPMT
ncbi:hypothetical protein M9H77_21161 [Catharanthus roseus]|uniref:Uncharacterized protein n=1 Tax=Catharanthus roseus TaxID=4058 RepID=A0ACC0AQW6_CATRO|nr:hypothetical protein M9H77_21161 [Catharanthus roseus]